MQKLAFGTDGIRGRVGDFPFIESSLHNLGLAIGHWIRDRYGSSQQKIKILVAGDTRESCVDIKKILFSRIIQFGIDIADAGIIPTPAVCAFVVSQQDFSCGIMISASHNPFHDNGIKLFDGVLGKITAADEEKIVSLFEFYAAGLPQVENRGIVLGNVSTMTNAIDSYVEKILATVPPYIGKGKRIVLDCAYGATFEAAPKIFRALGAEVIILHHEPNGKNINENAGALHPEELKKAVLANDAAIGFAFDGDGDRIVMVSAHGHVKDGDDVLAILLDLEEYAQEDVIVGTVMSNSGFHRYLELKNKKLVRAAVGDKHVVAKLEEYDSLVGGEPSGHIVLRNYLPSGDGLLVAVKILQSLSNTEKWALDLVAKFPQLTINVPVGKRRDLTSEPCLGVLNRYNALVKDGRILVRYSGTEPLLRVMVEGSSEQETVNIANQLALDLQQVINS